MRRATGPAGQPNVLVLVLDTVRADHIAAAAGDSSLTPSIAQVMAAGTMFVNAVTPAPWTLPSHASLFTGLYPFEHQATHGRFRLGAQFETIAERLRSGGYLTAGFSCNPWVSRANGFAQGFDVFEEPFRTAGTAADKGGEQAVAMITGWLTDHVADETTRDHPFFLFVNLLEAHLPYDPPTMGDGRFTVEQAEQYIIGNSSLPASDLARARSLYRAEIHYLDELVGRIMASLADLGLLDETIVIITSDHGEHLGEHGLFGHEFSLYETVLRVPLVVRYPRRIAAGVRDSTLVSLMDLLPTVLELTRQDLAAYNGDGRSLLSRSPETAADPRPLFAEYSQPRTLIERYWRGKYPQADLSRYNTALRSVRYGKFKYVQAASGREELFNLREDPFEQTDLSSAAERETAMLRKLLQDHLVSRSDSGHGDFHPDEPDSLPELDEARLRKLRSLGYAR